MAENTMNNAPGNEAENARNAQNLQNALNKAKDKFLKKFKNKALDLEIDDRLPILNDIIDGNLTGENSKLKDFLNRILIEEGMTSTLPISKFTIDDFQTRFGNDIASLKVYRTEFKKTIISEFDIDENGYDSQVLASVKKLTISEFVDLKKSKAKRREFIYKHLEDKSPSPKVLFTSSLAQEFQTTIQKTLEDPKTKQDKKEKLEYLVRALNAESSNMQWDSYCVTYIQELFEDKLLPKPLVLKFINSFMPNVSITKALDLGIITKNEAFGYAKLALGETSSNDSDLKEKIRDNYLYDIIQIETLPLIKNNEKKYNKLLEKASSLIAENIVEDKNTNYNELINEYKGLGPASFEALKTSLKESKGSIIGLDKFAVGSIFALTKLNKEGTQETQYVKIVSADDEKKELELLTIGNGVSINLGLNAATTTISYIDLRDKFNSGAFNLTFYNENDIEAKIKDPGDNLSASGLKLFTKEDLIDETKRAEYEKEYRDYYLRELHELVEERNKLTTEGKTISPSLLSRIHKLTEKVDPRNIYVEKDLLYYLNTKKLREWFDEIDPEGIKCGVEKGTYIETSDGAGYEITGISNEDQMINLSTLGSHHSISFEQFYDYFSKQKPKRTAKYNSFGEIIEVFTHSSGDESKAWSNYTFDGKEIQIKEIPKGFDNDKKTEFFESKTSNEIIKVLNISGGMVTFSTGTQKTRGDLYDKDAKKQHKHALAPKDFAFADGDKKILYTEKLNERVLFMDSGTTTVSLNDFKRILEFNKEEFVPNYEIGKNRDLETEEREKKFHNDLLTRILGRNSFETLVASLKMTYDGIDAYLKRGVDLRASKLAMKYTGLLGLASDELASEMQIKIEREEKEQMDKIVEDLGKIDSWMAAQRIEERLLNRNTSEYKKEAGMIFMLEKYGHLCCKTALAKYRGKFMWYEALGGTIGDEFYREQEAEASKQGIPFSEENLIHQFLKKQCGGEGYKGIKRRSRLHKEYENRWSAGIKADYEKGYGDATGKRTARTMMKGGTEEAMGGTIPNFIGWIEKLVERGEDLKGMNEGFFMLLFSGCLFDVDQRAYLKLKEMFEGKGMPIILARFSTTVPDMKLFNSTIVELCKEIGAAYPSEFPNIVADASSIVKMVANSKTEKTEAERLKITQQFWAKYGEPLAGALYMRHTTDGKYAKTDKIIMLKKDENPIFNSYYESARSYTDLNENVFHKDFMDDCCGDEGVSGLNTYRVGMKYFLHQVAGGFKDGKVGPKMWRIIASDINSVSSKRFHDDPRKDKEYKKKYLIMTLRDLLAALIELHGANDKSLTALNKLTSDVGQDLQKWGLTNIMKFKGHSATGILNGSADHLIGEIAEDIISGKTNNSIGNVGDFLNDTSGAVNKTIKPNARHDDDNEDDE